MYFCMPYFDFREGNFLNHINWRGGGGEKVSCTKRNGEIVRLLSESCEWLIYRRLQCSNFMYYFIAPSLDRKILFELFLENVLINNHARVARIMGFDDAEPRNIDSSQFKGKKLQCLTNIQE